MGKYPAILKIMVIFQAFRAVLHLFLYSTSPSKAVIEKDIERWLRETNNITQLQLPMWRGLVWLLWRYPEFRNLFYYRIKRDQRILSRFILEIAKLFYSPMNTLYLDTPVIGEGFFIQHGFSTIISAEKIGKNCWVNQQVTIGYSSDTERPMIGDNVHITAGAKVFGRITIGNNSIIGANAVVVKNVPPNCTVVGVPGYIIKRNNQKVKEPL
jgi:serine O-acetyltransferase